MLKYSSKDHPEICEEIEKQVRICYHLLPEDEAQGLEEGTETLSEKEDNLL